MKIYKNYLELFYYVAKNYIGLTQRERNDKANAFTAMAAEEIPIQPDPANDSIGSLPSSNASIVVIVQDAPPAPGISLYL
jgi:hypothetical protein